MTVAPIVRFALAYAAGVAAGLLSVPVWISLLVVLVGTIAPIPALRRPLRLRGGIVMVATAGALAGYATAADQTLGSEPACGDTTTLTGRFVAPPLSSSVPFARFDGCGTITVVLPGQRSTQTWFGREMPCRWKGVCARDGAGPGFKRRGSSL